MTDMFELTAKTTAGARLVRIAEGLAEDFAGRAAVHDREASFPHAAVDALKRARYFYAPIPAENGGLGVTSVHDVVVA
jgi:alkylation response protein AidB-like acyl-CoA dehydrogenase